MNYFTVEIMFFSFNRTILELKQDSCLAFPANGWTFNRTILELKQVKEAKALEKAYPFNRTILELKLEVIGVSIRSNILLIAPYWN